MKRTLILSLIVLSLLLVVGVAAAAPPAQEEEPDGTVYIVQPGDGLIKLARLFFGDGDAYLRIVQATNAMAENDSSYRTISDANIILVGQKLFIPGAVVEAVQAATGGQAQPAGTTPVVQFPLSGTSWVLTSLNGQAPVAGTAPTLDFVDDTQAAGSGGCNRFTTTYTYDPQTDAISFAQPARTLIACVGPVMEQENAYLAALAAASTYQVAQGPTLRLFDAEGATLAEFTGVSKELAGSSWTVTSYNNGNQAVVGVIEGTTMTASFEDGEISGSAGCNTFFGSYAVDGDAISIGPLASTRKLCAEEGVMEQEAAYLAALESAATYQISGKELRMRTADDAMAVNFVRAE